MHPRLLACLFPSIAAGLAGAAWCLTSGWGWLAALGVYSLGGSLVLVGLAGLTALIEARREMLEMRARLTARVLAAPASPADARGSAA